MNVDVRLHGFDCQHDCLPIYSEGTRSYLIRHVGVVSSTPSLNEIATGGCSRLNAHKVFARDSGICSWREGKGGIN